MMDTPLFPALLVGAFGVVLIALVFMALHRRRVTQGPDTLAVHALVAMSQVAIADGRMSDDEVAQIATILTRLTGTDYGPDQVMQMLQRLDPTTEDLEQVGRELNEAQRQIVLEAALNIAVADGKIRPGEYAVVADLAHHLHLGATQFRAALARIAAHVHTARPV